MKYTLLISRIDITDKNIPEGTLVTDETSESKRDIFVKCRK